VVEINDANITLAIDGDAIATARLGQHAAADDTSA
jgi:hypothetical protein